MNLTKTLREQGYDLIGGPVRNHKLLQLWLKRPFDEVQLYYQQLDHAFVSDVTLNTVENPALNINASVKDEYSFNIGLSILEDILKSIGLATLDLSSKIERGRKVKISYDNSMTQEVPLGDIHSYLSTCDFKHPNNTLLQNANRKNIVIVSGTLLAKNLNVEIETEFDISAELTAKLTDIADGKAEFSVDGEHTLKMVSHGNTFFPVAVKGDQIDFDRGHFDNTKLLTDRRNLF